MKIKPIIAWILVAKFIAILTFLFMQRVMPVERQDQVAIATDTVPRPVQIVAEEFIPFEYIEENGEVAGVNAEVTATIMDRLGIPYEITILPWLEPGN